MFFIQSRVLQLNVVFACLTTRRPTSCISSSRRIRPSDECLSACSTLSRKASWRIFSADKVHCQGDWAKRAFGTRSASLLTSSSWAVRSLLLIRSGPLQIASQQRSRTSHGDSVVTFSSTTSCNWIPVLASERFCGATMSSISSFPMSGSRSKTKLIL
uniref:Uncharacterized protein n=1 Tax=Escherichia coli TaxID=562 RepID=A0A8F1LAH1_ECOLX|nr:hypothetical protein EOLPNHPH_00087 [Escherichia coli]